MLCVSVTSQPVVRGDPGDGQQAEGGGDRRDGDAAGQSEPAAAAGADQPLHAGPWRHCQPLQGSPPLLHRFQR